MVPNNGSTATLPILRSAGLSLTGYDEDGGATGVNGVQDNGAGGSGCAYVFVRRGAAWSQEAAFAGAFRFVFLDMGGIEGLENINDAWYRRG